MESFTYRFMNPFFSSYMSLIYCSFQYKVPCIFIRVKYHFHFNLIRITLYFSFYIKPNLKDSSIDLKSPLLRKGKTSLYCVVLHTEKKKES